MHIPYSLNPYYKNYFGLKLEISRRQIFVNWEQLVF